MYVTQTCRHKYSRHYMLYIFGYIRHMLTITTHTLSLSSQTTYTLVNQHNFPLFSPAVHITFLPVKQCKTSFCLHACSLRPSLLLPWVCVCVWGGGGCKSAPPRTRVRVWFPTQRGSSTGPKTITHLSVLNPLTLPKQCDGCHCYLL